MEKEAKSTKIKILKNRTMRNKYYLSTMAICLVAVIIICMCVGCKAAKYPNYKVTPKGYVIWRYTKTQDEVKDVFLNGDTLFDNGSALVLIRKTDTLVLADYSKMIDKKYIKNDK